MTTEVKTMDSKKNQQQFAQAKKKTFSAKQTAEFFGEVKSEFKKITWTSKEELILYTKIVVGATFIFGMCLYGVDLIIRNFLIGLSAIFKLIIG